MTGEEGLVVGDILERQQALARFDLKHPVDEKKRIAVRKIFLDVLNIQMNGLMCEGY